MNFSPLFDVPFFIALTFLGVIVPAFSLSVSFLGHAIEKTKEEVEKTRKDAEKTLEDDFKSLNERLKDVQKNVGKNILEESVKIEKELLGFKESRKKFEKESKKILLQYDMLKFRGGVLIPGFWFACAIIFSSLSKICIIPSFAITSWTLSFIFLIKGVIIVCCNLRTIQEVALSSDQYQSNQMFDAISRAFETQAKSQMPELDMSFPDLREPFEFPKSTEISINPKVFITKGIIAKNVKILFLFAKDFKFLNVNKTWNQAKSHKIPYALTCEFEIGDVRKGINSSVFLKIKTPDGPGDYRVGYHLTSEECNSQKFFTVKIS